MTLTEFWATSILNLVPTKLALIEHAHQLTKFRSFADLGGVWRVNAGYSFHTLENYDLDLATIVDFRFTPEVIDRAKEFPNLNILKGNFGSPEVPLQLGQVDAILFFDVLLHQVTPDWDEMIEMYAPHTNCFIVYNQQLVNEDATRRLTDLSFEQYLDYAPYRDLIESDPERRRLLERLFLTPDEIHPVYQRPMKDIFEYWQWGITDADLTAKMKTFGFELVHFVNDGQFGHLKNCENHGFVFVKST